MSEPIAAHFDGKVIVPDDPIDLPTGQRLRVRIELVGEPEPPFAWLLKFAADLPDSPTDLAVQHDHYLCGTPKLASLEKPRPFGERYAQFKGAVPGLPADLAEQHDHYRLGTPKRDQEGPVAPANDEGGTIAK